MGRQDPPVVQPRSFDCVRGLPPVLPNVLQATPVCTYGNDTTRSLLWESMTANLLP